MLIVVVDLGFQREEDGWSKGGEQIKDNSECMGLQDRSSKEFDLGERHVYTVLI